MVEKVIYPTGTEIRNIWNAEEEEYYFRVVDVIGALTNSENPRNIGQY